MSKTRDIQRARHARGQCGRCAEPARQKKNGTFMWRCLECAKLATARTKAWRERQNAEGNS